MMQKYPDFFFIGAGKSGTSSIFNVLKLHPGIFLPDIKEPNFFNDSRLRPEQKHISQEKYIALYKKAEDHQLLGDFSTRYFICSQAPQNIFMANKNAKILIILRDPLERAYSDFLMLKTKGFIKNNFVDSVTDELNRLDANIIEWPYLVLTSLYNRNITNYMNVFDTKNILITYMDDLKNNASAFYNRIFDFLNIERINIDEKIFQRKSNVYSETKSTLLRDIYYNQKYVARIKFMFPQLLRKKLHHFVRSTLFSPAIKQTMPDEILPVLRPVLLNELTKLEKILGSEVMQLCETWDDR